VHALGGYRKVEGRVPKVSAAAGSIDGSTGDRFGAMCNRMVLYFSPSGPQTVWGPTERVGYPFCAETLKPTVA
jgi:hypothetical protein